MSQNKVQVPKSELFGYTFENLVFEVSFILESLASYETARNYNREVLSAKNNSQRLEVINSYVKLV
ncbi:hypothetical protein [Lederbergia citri]|uniref:Uncharacterized protein n=1 Tax=Lederbergia citri TaxID=2833580 RepID=A0A942TD97_9BACI|nr:hypothetical protein [Lederbergia citri]MBS4194349.1 hypothetical protein [Lederbergia citri]